MGTCRPCYHLGAVHRRDTYRAPEEEVNGWRCRHTARWLPLMDHNHEIIVGCHAASDGFSRGPLPELSQWSLGHEIFEFLGVRCREGRSAPLIMSETVSPETAFQRGL
ncbi:hypothetical protein B296_00039499 [Ensete ventricosum]|uniref:Uncharacterized protein n=1 Tax=Ensete ventricosum TaxID=4639 RepID=A0A426YRZ1_ENSVE|nr:hypothetical protein B296_00039499 [Ensete ventricosum]